MTSDEFHDIVLALRASREQAAGNPPPDLSQRRADFRELGGMYAMLPNIAVEIVETNEVRGTWFTPPNAALNRVLLHLHGGCYTMGGRDTHSELAARIAAAVGVRTFLLEYRLAPEYPYPAALNDAVSAYTWLLDSPQLDARDIAMIGDSAGGGLVTSMNLALRDAGQSLPAALVLLSPWLDVRCGSDSWRTRRERDFILDDTLREDAMFYLAGVSSQSPSVSPILADLSGLPSTLCLVGTEEVLFDDAIAFTDRASAAGVDARLVVGDGLVHVWPFFANAPEARVAIDSIRDFLHACWGG